MKIEGDYAIIGKPSEACAIGCLADWERAEKKGASTMLIPKRLILRAVTPKEGDAAFWWEIDCVDDHEPLYNPRTCMLNSLLRAVKANALTIGKTVGELRGLLKWAKDKS